MSISNYLEQAILQHFFKAGAGTATAQPTSLQVGLHTSDPTDAGTAGTEVSGGGYARQTITFGALSDGVNGKTATNSAQITFPKATANWGTVSYASIWDNAGNFMFSGLMVDGSGTAAPQVVNTNGQLVFDVGTLSIAID